MGVCGGPFLRVWERLGSCSGLRTLTQPTLPPLLAPFLVQVRPEALFLSMNAEEIMQASKGRCCSISATG